MKEAEIHVVKNGQNSGPFTQEQIQAMLAAGEIRLSDQAWAAGHECWKPLHVILGVHSPETAVRADATGATPTSKPKPAYFYISTTRLICMSVISFGVFINYWVYKNWSYLKERDGLKIMPFWRGWFVFFHFHSLLEAIKKDPKVGLPEKPSYPSGWLTFGLIVCTICGNKLVLPSLFTFLFTLPAHNYIAKINESADNPPDYSPWSFGQVLCALLFPGTVLFIILKS